MESRTVGVLAAIVILLTSAVVAEIVARYVDGINPRRRLRVAGVTLAIFAVATYLTTNPRADSNTSSDDVRTPTTTPPTTTPPTTTPPTTSPTKPPPPSKTVQRSPTIPAATVRWSGNFLLHSNNGLELDTRPATTASKSDNSDFGDLLYWNPEALGNAIYASETPIAVWTANAAPSRANCIDVLQTLAVGKVEPQTGLVLCVATTGGRIARLKIINDQYDSLLFLVTVWN